jgi:hypothetical protein
MPLAPGKSRAAVSQNIRTAIALSKARGHAEDDAALMAELARFCQQGQNSGKPGPCPEGSAEPASKPPSSSPAGRVASAVSGVRASLGRAAASIWDRLSPRTQAVLGSVGRFGKAAEHRLMIGFRKSREMVREAAKERGMSPQQADRVAKVVGTADAIAAWTVNMPATLAVTGSVTAAKISSWVPVGALAYLAYSTARNPAATYRAAKKVLAGKAAGAAAAHTEPDRGLVGRLLEGVRRGGEWYEALLYAALDSGRDLAGAAEAADEALGRRPRQPDSDAALYAELRRFTDTDTVGIFTVPPKRTLEKYCQQGRNKGKPGPCPEERPGTGKAGAARPAVPKPAPAAKGKPGARRPDPAANRPTRPEERDPEAAAKGPPPAPFKAPPPPQGKAGGGKPIRPTGDESNTKFGDKVEEAVAKLGLRSILPEGQRSHRPGEVAEKGSTIDREWDHSGYAFEVKACRVTATEYKCKPKKEEVEGKRKFAEMHGLEPAMCIPVVGPEKGEMHVYWREGIGSYKLDPATAEENGWHYMGRVKL